MNYLNHVAKGILALPKKTPKQDFHLQFLHRMFLHLMGIHSTLPISVNQDAHSWQHGST